MPDARFLAIGRVMGGSFYGQAHELEEACRLAVLQLRDWESVIGKLKPEARVTLTVYDYVPWDSITWDDTGVWGHKPPRPKKQIQPTMVVKCDRHGRIVQN